MEELNREAQIMMRNLTKLTQAIEELEVKTQELVTSNTRVEKNAKAIKEKQTNKATSNKIIQMKLTKQTDFGTVIGIILASSEGVSSNQIKKETGFDNKKISSILYKAKKRGLIKSLKKVVYRKTGKTHYKNYQQEIEKQESRIESKANEKKSKQNSSPSAGSKISADYVDASEWTTCSICSAKLKKKNLIKHVRKIHTKKKIGQKIVLLKNEPRPKKKKHLSSKSPKINPYTYSTTLTGGCPGCGAVYGCYCK